MRKFKKLLQLILSPSFKNSLIGSPVIDSKSFPWLTKSAVHYLETLDLTGKNVLEFGSGYSTEYFDRKGCNVISFERESSWIEFLSKRISSTTDLRLFSDSSKFGNIEYFEEIRASLGNKKFDILLVDVFPRPLTFEFFSTLVKDGGIIIFDNTDWYPVFLQDIKTKNEFNCIDFWGFPVGDVRYQCTSIIYKNGVKELKATKNASLFSKGDVSEHDRKFVER